MADKQMVLLGYIGEGEFNRPLRSMFAPFHLRWPIFQSV